jgi:hypothetical protein
MTAQEFIKNRLILLKNNFEFIKIRYEYRKTTFSHIVEIIPLTVFEENQQYLDEETNFENEFEKLFPNENIVFISENSLTEIYKSEFELGYEIIFNLDINNFEIEFTGYNETGKQNQSQNNYALAA